MSDDTSLTTPSTTLPNGTTLNLVMPSYPAVGSAAVTSTVTPSNATTAATPSAASDTEARIRHFQAEADRAKAEAAQHAAAAEAARKEAEALKGNQKEVLDGAAKAAQEAFAKAQEVAQALERERAERMKAEALLKTPELAPYASFIPATSDAEKLQEYINTFAETRKRDLATLAQAQADAAKAAGATVTTAAASPLGTTQQQLAALYPNSTVIPAASPARPSTNQPGSNPVEAMSERLRAAMDKALETGHHAEYEQILRESIAQSNAYVQQLVQ